MSYPPHSVQPFQAYPHTESGDTDILTRASPSADAARIQAAEDYGLYRAAKEHDACGVGFIAQIKNIASHQIVRDGLQILENLTHRGAVGADPLMGDGAGILVQIPHRFLHAQMAQQAVLLPDAGHYAVGHIFMPQDQKLRAALEQMIAQEVAAEGLSLLGFRDVPVVRDVLSQAPAIAASEPVHRQVFIGRNAEMRDQDAFERRLYLLRKVISNRVFAETNGRDNGFYMVCLSSRILVYKGMFLSHQLGAYYPDLQDPQFESAIALVHQRFSTNTFPSWKLAQPFRMVAHNGEINTLRGNVNWMAARQASVDSAVFGNDISKLWPISYEGQSDTACFDNALEFLVQGGYSLSHAMMMLIPEAWDQQAQMDAQRKAFYEYHAALMEPWDGPAALAFTDGRQIGAMLDRNGLRPARYWVSDDDRIVLASEAGVLPEDENRLVQKWRLQPGRILLVDLEQGRIISDEALKAQITTAHPYQQWLDKSQVVLEDLAPVAAAQPAAAVPDKAAEMMEQQPSLLNLQRSFGYTQDDLKMLLAPMVNGAQEPIGSMGSDTPLAVLSDQSRLLYSYFKQNFAQVTNPPIDPIREELVMSLVSFIGPRPNLLDLAGSAKRKRLMVRQPVLRNEDLQKIRALADSADHFDSKTLDMTYRASKGAGGMEAALLQLCERAEAAVYGGYNIIIISDRQQSAERIALPALLATAGVHHHLIRKGLRNSVGLVVESGEPREVHHFCCLAGYGAEAINPYLAFDTLADLQRRGSFAEGIDREEAIRRYCKALGKGLLKVMAKMGISTYQSYCGAQIFDALGLQQNFVDRYFFGTASVIEGVGLEQIAQETVQRHQAAFATPAGGDSAIAVGGDYAYRSTGEAHIWTPDTVAKLQHAVRNRDPQSFAEYSQMLDQRSAAAKTLRSLFHFRRAGERGQQPLAPEQVEPAAEIVKRFSSGAMSFGSISREAHVTLAMAMNQIGAKSNSGEGGEETQRLYPLADGSPNPQRSRIKQVASGRFGVSTEYLVNADLLQIKVAQGAKPGEGGQLPGDKVDASIAKTRHSTAGVGLISPPPHHDIYSIEDLAQLIFDLKNVNPAADISVKLVSEAGVGTVAAGVAKARADHITISGYDGGTGAAPLTALKHAGSPWETGLAEAQQILVLNGLRARIKLQVDGGLRTGRDVVVAAMLGADEFGFATAPLIAAGCIMMRKCHLNSCPVGVATQDPVLRQRFKGTPEHIINFFFYLAQDVRRLLAELGFSKLEQIIGRTDLLEKQAAITHWKARGLDFSRIFYQPQVKPHGLPEQLRHSQHQQHPLATVLDHGLIADAAPALHHGETVRLQRAIKNTDRSAGAMLSGALVKQYRHQGLPDATITVRFDGVAGQSFAAFLARGISFELYGEGNDYIGKGLSGGRIIVRPREDSRIKAGEAMIAGNTVLYGAIEGECYLCGQAGERFAVRNSGAVAVVEGVGDHGCEYMTGGVVVVLGPTGRNFAAGMSGGVAYIFDETGRFASHCNQAMVVLEPVPATGAGYGHDEQQLHQLLTRHFAYTGSEQARKILDDWPYYRTKFIRVMPLDYHKALVSGAPEGDALGNSTIAQAVIEKNRALHAGAAAE